MPSVTYTPAINEKDITNLDNGMWYFHVQLRNANGWGAVSHFRFQVDTQPPEPFEIKFVGGNETDNPRPTVLFSATDSLLGIAYYKVKIGESDSFTLSNEIIENTPYTLPLQMPGKRNILVQAFDKAGNFTNASAEFTILPPPSTLVKVGAGLNKLLATLIPLVALISLLILILLYGWRKLSVLRKKIQKETSEAESVLHKAFDLLKEDVREQIKMLEKTRTKRQLTKEEEKIIKQLRKDLDDAEKLVQKEIHDIEKEIR
ncbi:MAG: hypothetical protein UW34_C0006G0002 [Parcubacteria group bacterium GW2011_GWA2_44_15]|nr:MAG: hypothetical protein UW34_C0006G0002 [Parcubacteria group bacterium GW2011_GWA2_44_15]